ncbi:MAG: peptidylprolyl isomerase [Patescibacteria group bacterium]
MIKVTMQTEKGDIELELNKEAAPKTVDNFVKLSNDGFYNGLTFHRVIQEFMIQGGDPGGNGSGGPGYAFEDEINPMSIGVNEETIKELESEGYVYDYSLKSMSHEVGAISMANAGPNTNGSQFFIITQQPQPHLNGLHTVFGKVVNGMDIVRKIEQNDIINKVIINQ